MSRSITQMTIEDVEHISESERKEILDSYPEHERDARTRGIPALGSGRIFPISEEKILCDPIDIPSHWGQIIGMDFGWDHPFAAVKLVWDKDDDIIYVASEYREAKATPVIHAAAIRPWGDWIPCAWPHDGYQHDKGSGDGLAEQYREQSLNMLMEHATFYDGGNGIEAGVMDMLARMQTGRWKVFNHLQNWISEFRMYHRKDGKIVKFSDDLISASRYALMMKRYALQGGAGFGRKIEYPQLGII